ncbi:hypothetical protein [Endozoicomonas sp.]
MARLTKMDITALKAYCDALVVIRFDVKLGGVEVYSVHKIKMVCIFYDG